MNVAIIAYWNWDFAASKDEDQENEMDDTINYFHIKSVNDIPSDVKFSRYIISGHAEDIFTYSEMNNMLNNIKS